GQQGRDGDGGAAGRDLQRRRQDEALLRRAREAEGEMIDVMKAFVLLLPTVLSLGCAATQETKSPVFTRDIAPIVFARCAACHRPGNAGPFPLLEYGDLKKRSKQILEVVESRRMPPWKPMEGHGEFAGERRMTPEEVTTLKTWVAQGCVEGDVKELPPAPKFPEGWALGEPDLVVTMPEAYTVPAEGQDSIRAFTVPLGLTEDKYVRAIQFRPTNYKVVHHAMLLLDPTPESRRKDEADPA